MQHVQKINAQISEYISNFTLSLYNNSQQDKYFCSQCLFSVQILDVTFKDNTLCDQPSNMKAISIHTSLKPADQTHKTYHIVNP